MHKTNIHKDQRGIVSIIVSVIIMTILSLVVLSFAKLMSNEHRQALDRQLNTQAYYAAETAVNDVRQALRDGEAVVNPNDCSRTAGPLSDQTIDNQVISYSCVTVNDRPDNISYDSISIDRSTVFEVNAVNSSGATSPIDSLTFNWEDPSGNPLYRANNDFVPAGSWNSVGMLRVELIPLPVSGFSRDSLRTSSKIYYLVPRISGGVTSIGFDSTTSGDVVGVNCSAGNTPMDCSLEIQNLDSAIPSGGRYTVRLLSVYTPVSAIITGEVNVGGTAYFIGVQAIVDATGRANEVLERIRERISLNALYDYPEYAIDSAQDICKRISVADDVGTDDLDVWPYSCDY